MPKRVEQPAAHHRSYNAQHNVQQQSLSRAIHDFAANETSDQSKKHTSQNRHVNSFYVIPASVLAPPNWPRRDSRDERILAPRFFSRHQANPACAQTSSCMRLEPIWLTLAARHLL